MKHALILLLAALALAHAATTHNSPSHTTIRSTTTSRKTSVTTHTTTRGSPSHTTSHTTTRSSPSHTTTHTTTRGSPSHTTIRTTTTTGTTTTTTLNTRFFAQQKQDHFDSNNHAVWAQRYFVNETFWTNHAGPIFLCVGGEGPLADDVVVTGDVHCADMITIAAAHQGLVLAIEHRYYGISLPTPDFSTANLKRFLSSRQALADIATFHDFIMQKYGLTDRKWVTFGGSYPGMLAAWARLKYPDVIHAAVASSAPVQAQLNFEGYNDVVAASMGASIVGGSSACVSAINTAFTAVGQALGSSSQRRALEQLFNLCGTNSLDNMNNWWELEGYLSYAFPVQTNDPSCTTPGCNIAQTCDIMLNTSLGTPLHRLAALFAIYQGPTCLDVSFDDDMQSLLDIHPADGSYRSWTFQTCAEFAFYQTCDPGSHCIFTRNPWSLNLTSFLDVCTLIFNISAQEVAANVDKTNDYYGGTNPDGTRILFVNGDIDPWHVLSVLSPISSELPAFVVHGASHHFWTHPAQPTDAANIVAARVRIGQQVTQWLNTA